MRRRSLLIGSGATAALMVGSLPILLAARDEPTAPPAPARIPPQEHRRTVEALAQRKRARPVIAVLALNEGTEVCDLLSTYGVLRESGVGDVTVVAERNDPIRLYPGDIKVDTQATFAQFDASLPDGADYVVVPALEPRDDATMIAFIKAQHGKGATIVSVCNGALTLAAAGMLDGRRATGHWYYVRQLQSEQPNMEWVRDRRYVVDRGIATSTGITASIPLMLALVEAIGGRAEAERLAERLGTDDWDARHDSSAFRLTNEHRKTFVRNRLAFWRHDTVGIKVDGDVDEIAVGLMADAYARTELTRLIAIGDGGTVSSRRGLRLRPDVAAANAKADILIHPSRDASFRTLDRELARIASRYDRPTAALVALTMEYPWPEPATRAIWN